VTLHKVQKLYYFPQVLNNMPTFNLPRIMKSKTYSRLKVKMNILNTIFMKNERLLSFLILIFLISKMIY